MTFGIFGHVTVGILLLYLRILLLLLQFQLNFVSFTTISAVLWCCFKATLLVRISSKQGPLKSIVFSSNYSVIITWREKCRILVRNCWSGFATCLTPCLPAQSQIHPATGNLSQRLVFTYSRQLERLHFWLYICSGSLSDLTQDVYFWPW